MNVIRLQHVQFSLSLFMYKMYYINMECIGKALVTHEMQFGYFKTKFFFFSIEKEGNQGYMRYWNIRSRGNLFLQ